MDAQYDNPAAEDIFAEQSRKMPNGILELVRSQVRAEEGLSVEATNLMRDFLAGKLDSSDLVERAKALKHKTLLEA